MGRETAGLRGHRAAHRRGVRLRRHPSRCEAEKFSRTGAPFREAVATIRRSRPASGGAIGRGDGPVDRVEALILVATSARGDGEIQAKRKTALAAGAGTGSFRDLTAAAVAPSLHPANRGRTDFVGRIQAMGQRLGGDVFRRQSLLDRPGERAALGDIRCPTLVIAGDRDFLRSREESTELYAGIAGSSFTVVEGTGHMVPLEAPQRFAEAILGWLGVPAPPVRALN